MPLAYPQFAILLGAFQVSSTRFTVQLPDTMMADLVPPEKRADAYSLMRMSNNLGISIGP